MTSLTLPHQRTQHLQRHLKSLSVPPLWTQHKSVIRVVDGQDTGLSAHLVEKKKKVEEEVCQT